MADGPVCGAGFLRSVLQGALLRGFLLRLGLIVTYNQIPLFVRPIGSVDVFSDPAVLRSARPRRRTRLTFVYASVLKKLFGAVGFASTVSEEIMALKGEVAGPILWFVYR